MIKIARQDILPIIGKFHYFWGAALSIKTSHNGADLRVADGR
jgi:hypothetical protein